MKLSTIVNFADQQQKQRILRQLGVLTDPHRIELKPYRPRRSNRANAFYWAAIVTAFIEYNAEQGVVMDPEQAHDLIVRRCLGEQTVINQRTGEVIGATRRPTKELSSDEFSEFVERAIAWLAEFGIEVPAVEYREGRRRVSASARP